MDISWKLILREGAKSCRRPAEGWRADGGD
jgi:hypothetical protein